MGWKDGFDGILKQRLGSEERECWKGVSQESIEFRLLDFSNNSGGAVRSGNGQLAKTLVRERKAE